MDKPAWVTELFQAIDAFDADKFASFVTDDATFKFGNADPVNGKKAIRDVVAGFFSSIKAIRHQIFDAWTHPDAVICRGEVTYTRHNGSQLKVPFANIFKMQGKLVKEYLIYVDVSQLYA